MIGPNGGGGGWAVLGRSPSAARKIRAKRQTGDSEAANAARRHVADALVAGAAVDGVELVWKQGGMRVAFAEPLEQRLGRRGIGGQQPAHEVVPFKAGRHGGHQPFV